MNDDEINEIIARSADEAVLYHEMDAQRDREALENWRRLGNRGKPPPPLMQLEELPECFRTDKPFGELAAIDEAVGIVPAWSSSTTTASVTTCGQS